MVDPSSSSQTESLQAIRELYCRVDTAAGDWEAQLLESRFHLFKKGLPCQFGHLEFRRDLLLLHRDRKNLEPILAFTGVHDRVQVITELDDLH